MEKPKQDDYDNSDHSHRKSKMLQKRKKDVSSELVSDSDASNDGYDYAGLEEYLTQKRSKTSKKHKNYRKEKRSKRKKKNERSTNLIQKEDILVVVSRILVL